MKWLETTLYALFPTLLLQNTPWYHQWMEKERLDYLKLARVFFPLVAIGYLGHFFFFDRVLGLEPVEHWLQFRGGVALLALACLGFYFVPVFYGMRWYKAPMVLCTWVLCYLQAKVTLWAPEQAPWLYAMGFVVIAAILLQTSILKSLVFATLVIASQYPLFLEAGIAAPTVLSAAVVVMVFITLARASFAGQVRYFLLNQENVENQRKIIELNIDFTNRLKAFIPKEIANRLVDKIEEHRMTVLQAIDEVLRPRKCEVACLFSDIRGFTQGSKDLDRFINQGVMPNVKQCTDAVEEHGGIPRKIGDLIFAYFDAKSPYLNLLRCLVAGMAMARINTNFNITNSNVVPINRYILISSGEAIVGNLGGWDSSIEITALGSPVNLLSRIDELTKTPQLAERLETSDLILDRRSVALIEEMGLQLDMQRVDLAELGLTIRDFEEIDAIWTLRPTEENWLALREPYQLVKDPHGSLLTAAS